MYKVMNNGCKIPMVGLGCFKAGEESCVRAVETAISVGYRHFDTANHYENEKYVGQGIRNSGIDRSEVFVVSKIWPTSFHEPVKIIEFSLKALNLDYIDAYLIHWPGLDADARYRVWETLMRYKDMGYIKGVGVSNFKKAHLIDLKEKFGVDPCMNEFEISPWLQSRRTISTVRSTISSCLPVSRLPRAISWEIRRCRRLRKSTTRMWHRWWCAGICSAATV